VEWLWSIVCAMTAFVAAVFVGQLLRTPTAAQRRMQRQLFDLHERLKQVEAELAEARAKLGSEATGTEARLDARAASDLDASGETTEEDQAPATPPEAVASEGATALDAVDERPAARPDGSPAAADGVLQTADLGPVVEDDAEVKAAPRVRLSAEKVAVWLGASLGALALAIGALLGLVAAAEAGWISPGLRVATGLSVGVATWVLGASLRRRSTVAASGLSAAGASAVFGASWAATSLYGFLPAPVGFVLLLGVVAMAMAQASRFRDRFLGTLATVGGLFASTIIRPDDPVLRVGYGLVLLSSVSALASRRRWPELLVLGTVGVALQLIGWTVMNFSADHQLLALAGIVALSLPLAAVAARSAHGPTWGTAVLAAAAFPVLAAPWLPPIDPTYVDPRTGLVAMRPSTGAWAAAAGLLALPVPLWLAGRVRGSVWPILAGSLAMVPGLFAYGAGWTEPGALRALAPLGLLAAGLAVTLGRRQLGHGVLPMVLVGLFPLVHQVPNGQALLALVGFTALIVFGSWTSSTSLLVGLGLPVVTMTLFVAADASPLPAAPTAATAAACLGLLVLPTVRSWRSDPAPWLPWGAAVLAPAALFGPLYAAWSRGLGDGFVGLLPLLLAAVVLMQGAVLLRVHRVGRDSGLFATVVVVALAGITLALPLQLEERWLTVGLSVEAAALSALSGRLRHPLVRWTPAVLGAVVAVRLLLNPWALEWGGADGLPVLNWTLYTWGVPTLALIYVGRRLRDQVPDGIGGAVATTLQLLAMFTGFALVNVQVSHAFQSGASLTLSGTTMLQGMVRSLAWGGYGMLLLVIGLGIRQRTTRFVGFGFVLLAAVKVFVVDLWSLPGFIRVGSLLGLGLFLIVAAFLFERLVLRERPLESDGD